MDKTIQFLDFTGVEEQERNWLLTTLFSDNEKIQFPWKTPDTYLTELGSESEGVINPQQHPPGVPPSLILNTNINVNNNGLTKQPRGFNYPTSYEISNAYQPCCTIFTQPVNNVVRLDSNCYYQQKPSAEHNLNHGVPVQPNQSHVQQMPPKLTHTLVVNSNIKYNLEGCINTKLEITQDFTKHFQGDRTTNEQETSDFVVDNEKKSEIVNTPGTSISQQQTDLHKEKESTPPVNSWASLFSKPKDQIINKPSGVDVSEKPLALVQPFKPDKIIKNVPSNFDDPHLQLMAEFLFGYTINNEIISLEPRGLINKSNYCYINSILQALIACPPLYNLLYGLSKNAPLESNKTTPIIDNMIKFIKEFGHLPANLRVSRRLSRNAKKNDETTSINYDSPIEPTYIYKMLSGIRSDTFLIEGRQEDAEEFLGCLLNGLNDEMLELIKMLDGSTETREEVIASEMVGHDGDKEWQVMGPKNKGSITRRMEFIQTPINKIFGGLLRSRVHRAGDQSTDNIQPFFTLPLNIEKATTVREALEVLISKNRLEGITSSRTNQEVEAWQQVTLEELPLVLILHLKCFDFKLDSCSKIIKMLEFPIDLKIDSKLLSSKTNYSAKEKQYKLFAIVYHDGKEATKGHYITDAYHIGYASWLRYDDASVKPVREAQVLKPHGTRVPYLLFYRRNDSVRSK